MSSVSKPSAPVLTTGSMDLKDRWLSGAVALGTSMLPFLHPQDEIWHEPVEPGAVRPGDVVTFRNGSNLWVTHRVVKVLRHHGGFAFLTKGDNRLRMDPLVLPRQIIGRVIRVGRRDLTRSGWRFFGGGAAFFSYRQGLLYRRVASSRWNRLRHALERRGWLPRVRLQGGFRLASSPLSWIPSGNAVSRAAAGWRIRRRLARAGIRIFPWAPDHAEGMTRVWNEAFPRHRTTVERLTRRICRSPWFDPSGFFLAAQGGNPLGCVLAGLREETGRKGRPASGGVGYLEMAAVTLKGSRLGVDRILLEESLGWLRRQRVSRVVSGPLPVEEGPFGFHPGQVIGGLFSRGFSCAAVFSEMVVTPSSYRIPAEPCRLSGLSVRRWEPGDEAALRDFFRRNKRPELEASYQEYLRDRGDSEGILLAHWNGRPVGFCRIALDDRIREFSQCRWLWTVAKPEGLRGYFFHFVVDASFQGQGAGTTLGARAFEALFQQGCQEIQLWAPRQDLYERFGFLRRGRFMVMERRFAEV